MKRRPAREISIVCPSPSPVRCGERRDGTAEALPGQDGDSDAAVVSLVLCSVPDQNAALCEIARVLRPGGELRFYEHVVAHQPTLAPLSCVYHMLTG